MHISLHLSIKRTISEMLQKIRLRLIIIPIKAKKCIYKPENVQNLKDLGCSSLIIIHAKA